MLILLNGDELQLERDAAVDVFAHVSYVDKAADGAITAGRLNSTFGTSGTDAILTGPAASVERTVEYVAVFNADGVEVGVSLLHTDGTIAVTFRSKTLEPGDKLEFSGREEGERGLQGEAGPQGNPGDGLWAPGGRLTLVSATPVMSTTQTAKTAIFYTPHVGQYFPWFNGTLTAMVDTGGELTLALDNDAGNTGYHQSGKLFDLFLENSTATPRLVSGPAWTSDTVRGYSLAYHDGFLTNAATMTARFGVVAGNTISAGANQLTYVGTFRASANGQTEYSFGGLAGGGLAASLLLWNMYNRVDVRASSRDSTDSWSYNSATVRPSNNSVGMRVSLVRGLDEDAVDVHFAQLMTNGAGVVGLAGIGVDSTTVDSAEVRASVQPLQFNAQNNVWYRKQPGLGFHFFQALEWCQIAQSMSFYGDATQPANFQNGISVRTQM